LLRHLVGLAVGIALSQGCGHSRAALLERARDRVLCLERSFGSEDPQILSVAELPPSTWCRDHPQDCSQRVEVVVVGRYVPYECGVVHGGTFRCTFAGSHPDPLEVQECEQ
jgi:hypothetical protein